MIEDLLKRSTSYLGGLVLSKVLSVIAFILFARALLPLGFGQFVLFTTLLQVITFFADFGLVQWYQKHAHIAERRRLAHNMLSSRIATLGLSLIGGSIFIYFSRSFDSFVTILFLICLIPEALLSIVDGYFLVEKKAFRVSLKTTLRMGLLLISYFIFKNNFTFDKAVVLYLIVSLITAIWYFPWKLFNKFSFSSFASVWKTLNQSKSYAFLVFSSFAYSRGDSLIVRYSLNNVALGLYGSAYRYLESLSLIPTALAHNLFPISAKEGVVNAEQTRKITLLMAFLGVLISICVYLNAYLLVVGILGGSYIDAVPLLQIFSLVLVFFFINAPLNTIVLSSSKLNSFLPFGVGNTFLNLGLNLIFVPIYGVAGAAWVMLTTEIVGLFINLYFVRKVYSS